ncbi:MAG: hypothetical protein ACMUIE_03190 [Thermoplasmatota archaeon]
MVRKKRVFVLILGMNSELQIGSTVLALEYYLRERIKTNPNIMYLDNWSADRSKKIVKETGAKVLRMKEPTDWEEVAMTAMDLGKKSKADTIVILDLIGGNNADDAISLISKSISEEERFASAYIKPLEGRSGLGCWAIDKDLLGMVGGNIEMDIEKKLSELAHKENFEILAVDERVSIASKRQRRKLMKGFRRSPLEMLTFLMRHHPLTFYGSVGMGILLLAITSGFYTVDFFYENGYLNYFPAFMTVALVMIGGFFMVAGLMLNALNTLVERLEAMKKWVE